MLTWNGVGEPVLLRELISDSERLLVLFKIVNAPTRRHPNELQKIWIDIGKLFSNNHRSKRHALLSKTFGWMGTKDRFDDYLLTREMPSQKQKHGNRACVAEHVSKRFRLFYRA